MGRGRYIEVSVHQADFDALWEDAMPATMGEDDAGTLTRSERPKGHVVLNLPKSSMEIVLYPEAN